MGGHVDAWPKRHVFGTHHGVVQADREFAERLANDGCLRCPVAIVAKVCGLDERWQQACGLRRIQKQTHDARQHRVIDRHVRCRAAAGMAERDVDGGFAQTFQRCVETLLQLRIGRGAGSLGTAPLEKRVQGGLAGQRDVWPKRHFGRHHAI